MRKSIAVMVLVGIIIGGPLPGEMSDIIALMNGTGWNHLFGEFRAGDINDDWQAKRSSMRGDWINGGAGGNAGSGGSFYDMFGIQNINFGGGNRK